MSANYKRLLKILEKWPVDSTKRGRDFGEHLRNQAKKLFSTELSPVSESTDRPDLTKQLDALERLSADTYSRRFPRKLNSSATGLNREQCSQALSSEFLDYMTESDKSVLDSVNPKKA